MGVLKKKSLL